eukprot:Platyproteum_vivax@DN1658_c0_g1_i2.p1
MSDADEDSKNPETLHGERAKEAAQLDHLTDYVDEHEANGHVDCRKVEGLQQVMAQTQLIAQQSQVEKEKELASVVVKQADIDFLVDQLNVDKQKADRLLRIFDNDLEKTAQFLIVQCPVN